MPVAIATVTTALGTTYLIHFVLKKESSLVAKVLHKDFFLNAHA